MDLKQIRWVTKKQSSTLLEASRIDSHRNPPVGLALAPLCGKGCSTLQRARSLSVILIQIAAQTSIIKKTVKFFVFSGERNNIKFLRDSKVLFLAIPKNLIPLFFLDLTAEYRMYQSPDVQLWKLQLAVWEHLHAQMR